MGRYLTCWGLISCFAIALASFVEIHKDITVKPTPDQPLSQADSVDVSMNCTGSRYDIRYYITNKMRWIFIENSGKEHILTDSFYLTKAAVALFNEPSARLLLTYRDYSDGFNFGITIRGVTRADNGIYRCSLVDEDSRIIDSKEVKLTVVNPIERMRIQLYDAHHIPVSAADSRVSQNSQKIKIAPGQYVVKCVTTGSNPDPVMDLFLNGQKVHASIKSKQNKSSQFESYTGNLKAHSIAVNAQNTRQTLICKANIPGDFYQPSDVGITLMVQVTKPSIVCQIVRPAVGGRKIKCNVSAESNKDDLVCENVSWWLGKREQLIENDQNWKDESKKYDNLKSNCVETNHGLSAMLDIHTVNDNFLQENIFIVYRKGENVHKHLSTLHDVTTALASVVTSLPVIIYLALALSVNAKPF